MNKPAVQPNNPNFSSGPCSKRPNWSLDNLSNAVLGRSHRAKEGKAKLAEVINLSKELLNIPADYRVGIVPASDTGAMEMALWSLLGPKTVDMYAWEAFSKTWLGDVANQLQIEHNQYSAEYGELPDFSQYNSANDSVFVFNGTTSGVRLPNLDWIDDNRTGLAICDATSAVFSQDIDFNKLDVVTWSWQKALGGEAAHGMIVLSPRAAERLENYIPSWPMPKIFQMAKKGKIIEGIFTGATINTPSLLCVEDVIDSMNWIKSIGGISQTQSISDASLEVVANWVDKTDWVEFLAKDITTRSNTSVCLNIVDSRFTKLSDADQRAMVKSLCGLLDAEKIAYDINAYKDAPAGLRIWTGATVATADVNTLLPWIDWAFEQVINR